MQNNEIEKIISVLVNNDFKLCNDLESQNHIFLEIPDEPEKTKEPKPDDLIALVVKSEKITPFHNNLKKWIEDEGDICWLSPEEIKTIMPAILTIPDKFLQHCVLTNRTLAKKIWKSMFIVKICKNKTCTGVWNSNQWINYKPEIYKDIISDPCIKKIELEICNNCSDVIKAA